MFNIYLSSSRSLSDVEIVQMIAVESGIFRFVQEFPQGVFQEIQTRFYHKTYFGSWFAIRWNLIASVVKLAWRHASTNVT